MKDRVVLRAGKLPSKRDLLFSKIGDLLDANNTMAQTLVGKFVPNDNQQKLFDMIENSEVPDEKWIHVLLYGPRGSGKSIGAYAYTLRCLTQFPGSRALGVRTTSTDIKDSIYGDCVKFLNKFGIPYTPNVSDTTLNLANGSVFRMRSDKALTDSHSDKSHALGSTSYNIVIFEEADSISQELAISMAGSMRHPGKFRKVIFYLCNPPSKRHWLWKMFHEENDPYNDAKSRRRALYCSAEDNVQHVGSGYVEAMREDFGMNPNLAKRLGYGLPGADVKGTPYFAQDFVRSIHVSDTPLKFNPAHPMQRGWDFGFEGMALIVLQADPDLNQIRVFRSILEQQSLIDPFCEKWLPMLDAEFPGVYWEDYGDPAGRSQTHRSNKTDFDVMKEHGLRPKYSINGVSWGLSVISKLLRTFYKGRPKLIISPEAELLAEAFEGGYCNMKGVTDTEPRPKKDGVYDHCLAEGTLIKTPSGFRPIETLAPGDEVLTRWGWKPITKVWDNGIKDVLEVETDIGIVKATSEHRFWVKRVGWVTTDALRYGDECVSVTECNQKKKKLLSTVSGLFGIPTLLAGIFEFISAVIPATTRRAFASFIATYGSAPTVQSQKDTRSITRTETLSTTSWTIWKHFQSGSTEDWTRYDGEVLQRLNYAISVLSKIWPPRGTGPRKGEPGIENKVGEVGKIERICNSLARHVGKVFSLLTPGLSTVALNAEPKDFGKIIRVTPAGKARVYDLTVAGGHEYMTEVGLVHNCMDAFRYAVTCLRQPAVEYVRNQRAGYQSVDPTEDLFTKDLTRSNVLRSDGSRYIQAPPRGRGGYGGSLLNG